MVNSTELKISLQKTIDSFRKELSGLRTGQASIDLVEDILVEYYGVPTPMKQIAAISIPEPRTILITPWDKSAIAPIEKAILKTTHLGINPVSESSSVRLNIPTLTEERRKILVKEASTTTEKFRAEIRVIRDDYRGKVKDQLKKKEISEDEQKIDFDNIEKMIKEYNNELEVIFKQKEKDILAI